MDGMASINAYMEDTKSRNDDGRVPLGLVPLACAQEDSLRQCLWPQAPGYVEDAMQVTLCLSSGRSRWLLSSSSIPQHGLA